MGRAPSSRAPSRASLRSVATPRRSSVPDHSRSGWSSGTYASSAVGVVRQVVLGQQVDDEGAAHALGERVGALVPLVPGEVGRVVPRHVLERVPALRDAAGAARAAPRWALRARASIARSRVSSTSLSITSGALAVRHGRRVAQHRGACHRLAHGGCPGERGARLAARPRRLGAHPQSWSPGSWSRCDSASIWKVECTTSKWPERQAWMRSSS